jgi:hypothetical protein
VIRADVSSDPGLRHRAPRCSRCRAATAADHHRAGGPGTMAADAAKAGLHVATLGRNTAAALPS